MRRLWFLPFALGFFLPLAAGADTPAPDALIKNVSDEVLDVVRHDKDIQSGDSTKAVQLVQAKVVPHFDLTRMTRLAVARNWRKATPEQQQALTSEFGTLLVRTYSKALTQYRDQSLQFKPFSMKPEDTEARVRTQVNQPGSQPVPIDYSLEKTPDGWKVYDIAVGGISLVTTYRDEFAQQVDSGGIDGLIKTLRSKNAGGAATAPPGSPAAAS